MHARWAGYTLFELLATIIVVVLVLGVVLPVLSQSRRMQHVITPGSQARGIQQSLVLYAQGNGNYYPGLNSSGQVVDDSVENRFYELLYGNYFTGEYMISPVEVKPIWTTGAVSTLNYSYCMLQLNGGGAPNPANAATDGPGPSPATGRYAEWFNTINTQGAVLSDRGLMQGATATGLKTTSLYVTTTTTKNVDWRGHVAWNDNHVTFEPTAVPLTTKYGAVTNNSDDLFTATGTSDAWMIYAGTGR